MPEFREDRPTGISTVDQALPFIAVLARASGQGSAGNRGQRAGTAGRSR
jgi:hypothetical protein